MNETKRKFLLWYVHREIKKFGKKHNLENHKQQVAFLNRRITSKIDGKDYAAQRADVERLEQLLKWEYSLETHGQFGTDATQFKESVKNFSSKWLEPDPEVMAAWQAVAKETPWEKWEYEDSWNDDLKMWSKVIDGKTEFIYDTEYQKLRQSAGLPPRKHTYDLQYNAEQNIIEQDFLNGHRTS
jgi:hypothetical protein